MDSRYVNLKIHNVFTARNEVWGKVIFSEACVKNSVQGGSAPLHAGIHNPSPGPEADHPPLGADLLECILVYFSFSMLTCRLFPSDPD